MRKLFILIIMLSNAFGDGLVHDPINFIELAETLSQLKSQYNQLKTQYDLLNDQYTTAKDTLNSLQGSRDISGILNSTEDLQSREWLDSDWKNTLMGIAGGNNQRYTELYNQYVENHPNLSTSDYGINHTPQDTQAYNEQSQTTKSVAVIGQEEFDKINDQVEQLKKLGDQIDKTKDLKASSDLNARMTQQVGYIMVEVVRMQTALINLQASVQALSVKSKSDTARFFSHKG